MLERNFHSSEIRITQRFIGFLLIKPKSEQLK
jgi:hypothetical protein